MTRLDGSLQGGSRQLNHQQEQARKKVVSVTVKRPHQQRGISHLTLPLRASVSPSEINGFPNSV